MTENMIIIRNKIITENTVYWFIEILFKAASHPFVVTETMFSGLCKIFTIYSQK